MKDMRGVPIKEGDSVVLLRSKEMDFGRHSKLACGHVKRFTKKQVIVDVMGTEVNREPHNVVVARFPLAAVDISDADI